jgi:hypothetical protein
MAAKAERHAFALGIAAIAKRINVVCLDPIRAPADDTALAPLAQHPPSKNVAALPPEPRPGLIPERDGWQRLQ